jgi:hypothetical protein
MFGAKKIDNFMGGPPTRLSFMPNSSFTPCECNKCFFCKNGLTNRIAHQASKKPKVAKVTMEYKCGTRVTTNECTTERVNLVESGTIL